MKVFVYFSIDFWPEVEIVYQKNCDYHLMKLLFVCEKSFSKSRKFYII